VLPPAATAGGGRGRGGRGAGRGGAAGAAETPAAAEGNAGLSGELNTEFGVEAGAGRGGRGGGGGGGGGRGGFGGGVAVEPGEYKVTVTSAGHTDTAMVTVEEDPRVEFSSDDRAKRRKAIDTLTSLIRQADEPTRKAVGLTTALTSLSASWNATDAAPVPESVRKAVEDMQEKVKAAAGTFESPAGGGRGGGGGGAGARAAYTPPPVTQKLTRLMATIGNYSGAPTAQQLAEIEEAQTELQKGETQINALWDEVPKLNKVLSDAGVAYFKVTLPATAPAPGRGRGGN
jgi:hypothetical protein